MSTKTKGHSAFAGRQGYAVFAEPRNAPQTPAEMAASIQKLVHDFQEANNERLQQIESRLGGEDGVTREKVDRMNSAITDLQNALDTQLRELASQLTAGGGTQPDMDKMRAMATAFYCGRQGVTELKVDDSMLEAYRNYSASFARWLRNGNPSADIMAAMSVGSDPDGGYWVPGEMSSRVIQKLFDTSPMRQIADVLSITVDSITWPNDLNDATTGGFVGEHTERTETATQQVGEQTIYVREQYAMPIVTQKLLDMATIDVEAWLAAKIADKFIRVENTKFVSGTGVVAPRGFLDYKTAAVTTDDDTRSWGVLQYVLSGAAGGFPTVSGGIAHDPDSLITIVSKLHPQYRNGAVFAMNRATEAAIRKLKDADGHYFIGNLQTPTAGFTLLGYPIVNLEDMPDPASDSFSLAFGNFRQGYQIVDGRGFRVIRDNLTTKGKVKFYTTKWTGGDVVNFDAIKLMKFAAS